MDKKDKFIVTNSPETALKLKTHGFDLVGQDGVTWYFINNEELLEKEKNNKKTFDKLKFSFTNRIVFTTQYGCENKH